MSLALIDRELRSHRNKETRNCNIQLWRVNLHSDNKSASRKNSSEVSEANAYDARFCISLAEWTTLLDH